MESENIVTFQLQLTRRKAWLLLTAFFICWHPGFLGSESLTLTTYYPAPFGGYVSLLTTGRTLLARDGGNVLVGMSTQASPVTQKLDVSGNVRATGEMIGTMQSGSGQFRAIAGSYGAIIRNDGADTYLPLVTAPGDRYGSWNALRPLRVNNASGDVYLADSRITLTHANGNINTTGKLTGLCTTVNYASGTSWCPAGARVMATYGTTPKIGPGQLFLGGALGSPSRWTPHIIEGIAGTMLCCRISDQNNIP